MSDNEDATVLVVDDEEPIRRMMARILDRAGYHCITAGNLEEARQRLKEEDFALVMTDMDMPGGSGLDLLSEISHEHPEVATMLLTGVEDPKLADSALDIGAYGYLIKPLKPTEILIQVNSAMRRRRAEIENRAHRERLEQMVRARTEEMMGYIGRLEHAEREMRQLQDETIRRLSLAAEFRDDDTPRHVERMSRYCSLMADRYGIEADRSQLIQVASSMHDVGKIGIPDSILMKPGKLTEQEWTFMKRHCEIGHRLLSGTQSEVLNLAATIALTHHERVDGSGYPQQLKGEDIPIEGRITAIADVFDALTSNRVYSKAKPLAESVEIMRAGRGSQFDETLLDIFLNSMGQILGIKERYADAAPAEGEASFDPDID
jgi:putative two-component system response regulator